MVCLAAPTLFAQSEAGDNEDFAKDLYNEYLDNLPDDWAANEEKLRENLMRSFRVVLRREDPLESKAFLASFRSQDLQFQRVNMTMPFVRGLFKEASHLKPTEFMYIVKTGPYIVLFTYRADPRRFIMSEYQNKFIKKRAAPKDDDGHSEDQGN